MYSITGLLLLNSLVLFVLSWLYIFQLKEYRFRRILDFFKSKKGRQFLLQPETFGHPLVAVILFSSAAIVLLPLAVLIVLWMDVRLIQRKIARPVRTTKSIVIGLTAFLLYTVTLYWFAIVPYPYAVLYLLLQLDYLILVQFFQIPTYYAKRRYIAQAAQKLSEYTNLQVIGITGSYGKTSTRNYLVQILSNKYKVVTTPKNINTEIGVARFILDHDFSSDEIFVVEMGAYRKGEIKLIADMVRPDIGIITTIGPEHLALFGSMENIRDGKGELFAALKDGGLAVTNADNSYCRTYADTYSHVDMQTFGTSQLHHPHLLISFVQQVQTGITATFNFQGEDIEVSAPLYGTHNAQNIAAAYIVASQMGMEHDEILAAVQTLQAPPHRLNRVEKGTSIVLDDSYNSNPEGFIEALSILSLQNQAEKVVITRGMLELGEKQEEEHVRVGTKIGEVATKLIIISPDNAAELRTGAFETNPDLHIEEIYDMASVERAYHDILSSENVAVLLENRVPKAIIDSL